jgi:hypothetical protein
MDISFSGWWLVGCMDGCFGRCVVVGCIYACMCRWIVGCIRWMIVRWAIVRKYGLMSRDLGGFLVYVWLYVSLGGWCLGRCMYECFGKNVLVGWIYGCMDGCVGKLVVFDWMCR